MPGLVTLRQTFVRRCPWSNRTLEPGGRFKNLNRLSARGAAAPRNFIVRISRQIGPFMMAPGDNRRPPMVQPGPKSAASLAAVAIPTPRPEPPDDLSEQ